MVTCLEDQFLVVKGPIGFRIITPEGQLADVGEMILSRQDEGIHPDLCGLFLHIGCRLAAGSEQDHQQGPTCYSDHDIDLKTAANIG